MGRQTSFKGKKQYKQYQTESRATKNKIRKLERHIKQHPNDEIHVKHLERIKKSGYKIRTKPNDPGSNKVDAKIRLPRIEHVDTPAEQLSKLLGIPIPKRHKSTRKPKIVHKKRRDVKA